MVTLLVERLILQTIFFKKFWEARCRQVFGKAHKLEQQGCITARFGGPRLESGAGCAAVRPLDRYAQTRAAGALYVEMLLARGPTGASKLGE